MDIKDRVSPEDKQQMNALVIECQVLNNLLKERLAIFENKAKDILAQQGLSPQTYVLKVDTTKDSWEAVLKEGALVVPNREVRRDLERRKN